MRLQTFDLINKQISLKSHTKLIIDKMFCLKNCFKNLTIQCCTLYIQGTCFLSRRYKGEDRLSTSLVWFLYSLLVNFKFIDPKSIPTKLTFSVYMVEKLNFDDGN